MIMTVYEKKMTLQRSVSITEEALIPADEIQVARRVVCLGRTSRYKLYHTNLV